jgi:hypothetical protein
MNYCPKCGAEEVKEQHSDSWRFKCYSNYANWNQRDTLTTYREGFIFNQTLTCANRCITDLQNRLSKVEKYLETMTYQI